MSFNTEHIVWHSPHVTIADRQKLNNHKSYLLWFTGLSGAGKSTLASSVEKKLYMRDMRTYLLDGDNVRHGLNNNLGFSPEDRTENIRRIGEVSKLFVDAGMVCLAAFISPYQHDRDKVRALLGEAEFIEIYVKCPLEVCESRDSKGLYGKAKSGEIKEFTGISAPYEEPLFPEIIVETAKNSLEESVEQVLNYLQEKGYY